MTCYFSHLECSAACGAALYDPHQIHHLCRCGAPLLARYDLDRARAWNKDVLCTRARDMWRYHELMPLSEADRPVSLGEGGTPLVHAQRLGHVLGFSSLYVKDESQNPTQSFKARGLSAAVTRALSLGVKTISIPSAGNAGSALAAYAARAQLEAKVFLPHDVKKSFIRECLVYGADVTLVEGLITDAGRLAADRGRPLGWYDVSTLKEPYRIEGKKTMGYEIAEQLNWQWPDWIVYPTGGGTGLIGMWKACDELERIGWMPAGRRPRFVSVQADGCAPIVRAFNEHLARAKPWDNARTVADGLRVPHAIGDFLILKVLAESGGTAISVSDDEMIEGMRALGRHEGISAAPEGGATVSALRRLKADGTIHPDETVVLFNTGGALKYLELIDRSDRTS
jgi:threonine synthase